MEIQTERLLLKKYGVHDKTRFLALFTDEKVMKRVDEGVLSKIAAEKLFNRILNDDFKRIRKIWAVATKADESFTGHVFIGQRPSSENDWEIGFILAENPWGNGFATEIARALIGFGLDSMNLKEIYATVDDDHVRSINVLKKAGMKFIRYEFDKQGKYSVYGLRKTG
ncbi:MAG: GNAT family N-acetyltransferase [Pyrinomonadaceae bacterium]|nr:GNAT family N-acetyltransferase [Pyrinomonadaceae bacterium]